MDEHKDTFIEKIELVISATWKSALVVTLAVAIFTMLHFASLSKSLTIHNDYTKALAAQSQVLSGFVGELKNLKLAQVDEVLNKYIPQQHLDK